MALLTSRLLIGLQGQRLFEEIEPSDAGTMTDF